MARIPASWMPRVPMRRIHGHWTAGGHRANSTDLRAYHFLWEGDGKPVRGVDVSLNSGSIKNGYAAHTLNANTDAIGVSMCGMMGAREAPFDAGPAPLTKVQWDAFVRGTAQLADFYAIPIGKKTTLFHAEVPIHLGIAQRNKWDVMRLPFDPAVSGAVRIGDRWRDEMLAVIGGTNPAPADPIPAGGTARVDALSLNFRRGPGTDHAITGQLPQGTILEVGAVSDGWVQVTTPAGHVGWVSRQHITMIDGPAPVQPTTPDPRRLWLAKARADLDQLEATLNGETS